MDLDLLIVGTGPAASRVAESVPDGWRAAICDARTFGGTCALRGCNPKKALVSAAETVDRARRMRGKAFADPPPVLDWPTVVNFKRSFIDPVPEAKRAAFRDRGLALLDGAARFTGPNAVLVGETEVHADRIVIGAGARPVPLGIPGEDLVTTSAEFLELDDLPESVLFIGGGYISFEFAHVVARAGRTVTILQRGPRVLTAFDPDLVEKLLDRTRGLGVRIVTDAEARGVERTRSGRLRVTALKDGEDIGFDADLVVHGAGREPNLQGLDLERGGVDFGPDGVAVDEFLRSTGNPSVWAGGDAAANGVPMLTPAANADGRALAHNLLHPDSPRRPDYRGLAGAVFTVPALAAVGLLEDEAREHGLDFESRCADLTEKNSVLKVGETHAGSKILVERGTGRIIGAHILGPDAAEVINVFALAIRFGISADDLETMPFAFPTFVNDVHSMVAGITPCDL